MCTPRYEFYGKKCGEVFFATSVIVVQLVVAGSRCQLAVLLCCWQLRTRLNYVVDHCWSCVLSLIACDLAPLRCVVMMFFLLFLMTHIVRLLLHREPRPAKQPLGLISRIVVCQWVHDRCLSIFEHSSMQRLVLLRCQHLVYNFLASKASKHHGWCCRGLCWLLQTWWSRRATWRRCRRRREASRAHHSTPTEPMMPPQNKWDYSDESLASRSSQMEVRVILLILFKSLEHDMPIFLTFPYAHGLHGVEFALQASCEAARELTELQALQDPDAGEEWKTAAWWIHQIKSFETLNRSKKLELRESIYSALDSSNHWSGATGGWFSLHTLCFKACDSLESKWKQFVADSSAAVEDRQFWRIAAFQ